MFTVLDEAGPIAPSLTPRFLFEHTFCRLLDNLHHPNGLFNKSSLFFSHLLYYILKNPNPKGISSTCFKLTRTAQKTQSTPLPTQSQARPWVPLPLLLSVLCQTPIYSNTPAYGLQTCPPLPPRRAAGHQPQHLTLL